MTDIEEMTAALQRMLARSGMSVSRLGLYLAGSFINRIGNPYDEW